MCRHRRSKCKSKILHDAEAAAVADGGGAAAVVVVARPDFLVVGGFPIY